MEKILIIKCGSNVLTGNGDVSVAILRLIAGEILYARIQGYKVVLVSSGAVACGKKFISGVDELVMKQVAAAVGQPILMHHWREIFAEMDITVGQFLETHEAFRQPSVSELLRLALNCGIVPIINENDVVSIQEMKELSHAGDNDMLSAIVAVALKAERLILLTDVDGLYASLADKEMNTVIHEVAMIDEGVLQLAGLLNSGRPTGMLAKLLAAQHAAAHGVHVWIANGKKEVIPGILAGKKIGTHCLAQMY